MMGRANPGSRRWPRRWRSRRSPSNFKTSGTVCSRPRPTTRSTTTVVTELWPSTSETGCASVAPHTSLTAYSHSRRAPTPLLRPLSCHRADQCGGRSAGHIHVSWGRDLVSPGYTEIIVFLGEGVRG
jgi:hypothetical protein